MSVLRLEANAAGLAGLAGTRTGGAIRAGGLLAERRAGRMVAVARVAGAEGLERAGHRHRRRLRSGRGRAARLGHAPHRRGGDRPGDGLGHAAGAAGRDGRVLAVRGTTTDAFTVSGSRLSVWSITAGTSSWSRTQTVEVPVPYGSSS